MHLMVKIKVLIQPGLFPEKESYRTPSPSLFRIIELAEQLSESDREIKHERSLPFFAVTLDSQSVKNGGGPLRRDGERW